MDLTDFFLKIPIKSINQVDHNSGNVDSNVNIWIGLHKETYILKEAEIQRKAYWRLSFAAEMYRL